MRMRFLAVLAAAGLSALAQPAAGPQHKPGVFDYYVLALSWSPQFCAGPSGSSSQDQCGGSRRYGFVVHGLWPQFETGWPENCAISKTVPPEMVESIMPIMPSSRLIQHEWDKHGTCSGLGQQEYFAKLRQAFEGFKVPEDFRQPLARVQISPAEFRKKVLAANPGLRPDAVRANCSGRYLSEVQICFSKELGVRACGSDLKDRCSVETIILRPVR